MMDLHRASGSLSRVFVQAVRAGRRASVASALRGAIVAFVGVFALCGAQAAPSAAERHPSRALWLDIKGTPSSFSGRGARQSVHPRHFRAITLDRLSLAGLAPGTSIPTTTSTTVSTRATTSATS